MVGNATFHGTSIHAKDIGTREIYGWRPVGALAFTTGLLTQQECLIIEEKGWIVSDLPSPCRPQHPQKPSCESKIAN